MTRQRDVGNGWQTCFPSARTCSRWFRRRSSRTRKIESDRRKKSHPKQEMKMPKYLIQANYIGEGGKGLLNSQHWERGAGGKGRLQIYARVSKKAACAAGSAWEGIRRAFWRTYPNRCNRSRLPRSA